MDKRLLVLKKMLGGKLYFSFGNNRLFPHLHLKEDERKSYYMKNLFLDWSFSRRSPELSLILDEATRNDPEIAAYIRTWEELDQSEIHRLLQAHGSESLFSLSLMLTGACNCRCEVCYSDSHKKPKELTWIQIRALLDQAGALGIKNIYVAGEGEPTLDPALWDLLSYAKDHNRPLTVYTNGLVFSNEKECRLIFGASVREALENLADYPVYFFFKFWSTRPEIFSKMVGTDRFEFVPAEVQGHTFHVPKGIELACQILGKEKVGVQVLVLNENLDDVLTHILPYVVDRGLASYVDEKVLCGRSLGTKPGLDSSNRNSFSFLEI